MTIASTVFVDADNTLWDTDAVFAHAQLNLLEQVEDIFGSRCPIEDRLAFVRELDQRIAQVHHRGLRYPPRLLIYAIGHSFAGVPAGRTVQQSLLGERPSPLSEDTMLRVERSFFEAIGKPPDLRPGVIDGLAELHEAGVLVLVVTEASRDKTERLLRHFDLYRFMNRLIEGKKRPELYSRVLRLPGLPARAYMVGDQLDRDIGPAKVAGLVTIYFPGGFRPRWISDEGAIKPDYRIESFMDVPRIVLSEQALASAAPSI
jgi:putative hydrolase of the HAD superfamily